MHPPTLRVSMAIHTAVIVAVHHMAEAVVVAEVVIQVVHRIVVVHPTVEVVVN